MSTITAKDLTKDFPRSPLEELDGVLWLPRLIDKVRALQAGTLGDYTPYPCGGDRNFLAVVGVDADQLKAVIDSGAGDTEIAGWVKAHAAPGLDEHLAAYRERALAPVAGELQGYLDGALTELKAARPDLDISRVDNFTRLLCLEESYPCPGL
jgi:hypothetical protein